MLEFSVLCLISKNGNFVDVRVPFGSMETICRWFINDHNDFIIQIVGCDAFDSDFRIHEVLEDKSGLKVELNDNFKG